MAYNTSHVVWFEELRRADVPRVGGKNASLGEMVGNLATSGVKVPPGFATTADAYWRFVEFERVESNDFQCVKRAGIGQDLTCRCGADDPPRVPARRVAEGDGRRHPGRLP